MGVRTPYPSRTAGQAYKEINQYGRLRPDPEHLAGQRALEAALKEEQVGEDKLITIIRKIVNPYPKEKEND